MVWLAIGLRHCCDKIMIFMCKWCSIQSHSVNYQTWIIISIMIIVYFLIKYALHTVQHSYKYFHIYGMCHLLCPQMCVSPDLCKLNVCLYWSLYGDYLLLLPGVFVVLYVCLHMQFVIGWLLPPTYSWYMNHLDNWNR